MSKNTKGTILNENTIRRFMKLAAIEPLTENYLDQFNEEEDEMAPAEEPAMDDMGAEEPAMDMEMGAEEPAAEEGAAAAVPQEAVEEIVAAIASAVEEVTGTPVSSEPADDMAAAEEPAMDAEAPADDLAEPAGEEEEAPATRYEGKKGVNPFADKEDKEDEDESDEDVEEALIKRVAQRVAERLTARKNK